MIFEDDLEIRKGVLTHRSHPDDWDEYEGGASFVGEREGWHPASPCEEVEDES